MDYNVEFTIDWETLKEDFERTVSLVAAQSTAQDGTPLYDAVRNYARDEAHVERYIKDAVRSFHARFAEEATVVYDISEKPVSVKLYLPDISTNSADAAASLFGEFIHDKAVSLWFIARVPDMAKFYAESAVGTLSEIVIILKTRKKPERE